MLPARMYAARSPTSSPMTARNCRSLYADAGKAMFESRETRARTESRKEEGQEGIRRSAVQSHGPLRAWRTSEPKT